ncbi:MAG: 4'-phosphopantetheinyl transferase superfamily protein [Pseudomonadota bacterium]
MDDVPALSKGDIHCWRIALDQAYLNEDIFAADEISRAARYNFERDRRRFLAGRRALRCILGGYLGAPPEAVRFATATGGRPCLADASTPLNFNYSRSHNTGLLGVSLAGSLGIDIERIDITPDLADVAKQNFSALEQAALSGLSGENWGKSFYAMWTCKEAVVKALGGGLGIPLNSFDIGFDECGNSNILRAEGAAISAKNWRLHSFAPEPGAVAAIASDIEAPALHYFTTAS